MGIAVVIGATGFAGADPVAEAPSRVVSINLCTDQLALLIAVPGQIAALSELAFDASYGVDVPPGVGMTLGQAEDVHAMAPDLVLAGTFSGGAAVAMLERLGHRVERFAPEVTLDDIRANIRRMGDVLEQPARAAALVAEFDAGLRALQDGGRRPRAALWFANGYAPGPATLAGQILEAAGFANVAVEAGIDANGFLSLEQLVLLAPEVIVTGQPYPGASRAEDILRHPVIAALNGVAVAPVTDRDWVCGTPTVLRAVAGLVAIRRGLAP